MPAFFFENNSIYIDDIINSIITSSMPLQPIRAALYFFCIAAFPFPVKFMMFLSYKLTEDEKGYIFVLRSKPAGAYSG